ncbi:MAG: hypothetical protein Ta2A_03520 [Treponemataceae bacterium]|nr:MAG: hypothetical protein Ta2A_03520 [Treponemataceae bacterium]
MFSEYERKNAGYRLLIKSKLCELALLFFRELPETPPPTMQKSNTGMYVNERLECIMSFVFQNYDNPNITLADAADATFVSKFHFTRFFRKHIGQSFHSYLSMVRVSHAVENLLKTDMRITDIAYQCGFSSLKTFNRVFKTYAGKSPSEYRALR